METSKGGKAGSPTHSGGTQIRLLGPLHHYQLSPEMRSDRIRDTVRAVGGRSASRDLNPAQGVTQCVLTSSALVTSLEKGDLQVLLIKNADSWAPPT